MPRRRRPPTRFDDGAAPHHFSTVDDLYRKEYFEVIDCVKGELQRRFCQDSFLFVRNIECLLLSSANGTATDSTITDSFKTIYANDIDIPKLLLQLQMLPDAMKSQSIKKVTKVDTICDVLNDQPYMLTEVHKLLKIYFTIPVTTAIAERSFSALKRIKTYLRNSMTQQRLNNCMLLQVNHTQTDELDVVSIAREFVNRNDRRKSFFGEF